MEKETNKKTTTIRDSIIPITSTQSPIIIKIVVFNPIQGIKTEKQNESENRCPKQ
jgi:hypothetical protein